jgi:hypothetical protein
MCCGKSRRSMNILAKLQLKWFVMSQRFIDRFSCAFPVPSIAPPRFNSEFSKFRPAGSIGWMYFMRSSTSLCTLGSPRYIRAWHKHFVYTFALFIPHARDSSILQKATEHAFVLVGYSSRCRIDGVFLYSLNISYWSNALLRRYLKMIYLSIHLSIPDL